MNFLKKLRDGFEVAKPALLLAIVAIAVHQLSGVVEDLTESIASKKDEEERLKLSIDLHVDEAARLQMRIAEWRKAEENRCQDGINKPSGKSDDIPEPTATTGAPFLHDSPVDPEKESTDYYTHVL